MAAETKISKDIDKKIYDLARNFYKDGKKRQELLDAVAYVDRQMREIRDSSKQNNAERVAVMTALNVTHELLKVRVSGSVDLGGLKRRIQTMQSTIDAALAEQEKLF